MGFGGVLVWVFSLRLQTEAIWGGLIGDVAVLVLGDFIK
jgi:hypothetical protein